MRTSKILAIWHVGSSPTGSTREHGGNMAWVAFIGGMLVGSVIGFLLAHYLSPED